MDRFAIMNLMVYHLSKSDGILKEMPCAILGDPDVAMTQKHIIRSIYTELTNSGKDTLTVTRGDRTFTILPLLK